MNKIQTTILIDKIVRGLRLTRGGFTNRSYSRISDSFRVQENHIVFDAFYGKKIGCNPLFMFRDIVSRFPSGTFKYTWVTTPSTFVPDDIRTNPDVRFVSHGRMDHLLVLSTAKYIVYNATLPFVFAPKNEQILLSTWHGVPIKKLGVSHDPTLQSSYNTQRCLNISDIILSSGEFFDHAFLEATLAPLYGDQVQHVGFPRNDIAKGNLQNQKKPKTDKPKLLYAPTWRGRYNAIDHELSEHISTCEFLAEKLKDKFEVYVSLHHLVANKIDWANADFRQLPDGADINEFLSQVDLLVSDYSSIVLDYLLLDRPIVLYTYDLLDYKGDRGFSLDYSALPCQFGETREQVLEMILTPRKPSEFSSYQETLNLAFEDQLENASSKSVDLMLNYKRGYQNSDKKRVLIYPSTFKRNGITNSFLNLMNAIDTDLVDVFIACETKFLDRDPSRREQFDLLPNKVRKILFQRGPQPKDRTKILRKLGLTPSEKSRLAHFENVQYYVEMAYRRHLRDIEFDVAIDFSGYDPFGTMLTLAAPAKKRAIFQHNDIAAEIATRGNVNWVITESYKKFDEIVSVTPILRDLNRDAFSDPGDRGTYSYCHNLIGADFLPGAEIAPCPWASKMRDVRKQNPDARIFVNTARVSVEKNHKRLLRAFSKLKATNPNAFLFILGDGPELARVKQYARNLGLEDSCFFAGFVQKPAAAVKEADAFVLSSDYEGQCLAVLEALALGTPCVSTNHPVMQYTVRDGLGVLTEKDDKALADGMAQVISEGYKPKRFDAKAYNDAALNEFYNLIGVETP